MEVGAYSGPDVRGAGATMRSSAWELRLERRPQPAQQPPGAFDLTGTWAGQDEGALLARVTGPGAPAPPTGSGG